MNALYKGFVATAILSLIILYPVTDAVIGLNTEYTVNGVSFNGMSLYFVELLVLL
jgi:K(+)-stimulated pyrophosphate-energized sodium pump